MKFEHAAIVLKFKQKTLPFRRADMLQGLDGESADTLARLSRDGWEMVSVMPFVSGSSGATTTDSALAFFKREAS